MWHHFYWKCHTSTSERKSRRGQANLLALLEIAVAVANVIHTIDRHHFATLVVGVTVDASITFKAGSFEGFDGGFGGRAGGRREGGEAQIHVGSNYIVQTARPTPLYTCFPAPNSTPCSGEISLAPCAATALILRQHARITAQCDLSIHCAAAAAAAALVAEVNVWWRRRRETRREELGTLPLTLATNPNGITGIQLKKQTEVRALWRACSQTSLTFF